MIRYVKRLGALEVLWFLEVLGLGSLEFFLWWLLCALYLSTQDVLLGVLSILSLQIMIPVLFYVFTNGAVWSPSTLLYLLWGHSDTWDCCFMGLCLNFYCGGGCRCGGIGQSFLDSNKFSDVNPAPGHGVPALVGICSSGGGLLSGEEPPWGGFPWNFPFAKFIIVMGMVSGICMVTLSAWGMGMGLATTCTLYLLVGISFLLLSLVLALF